MKSNKCIKELHVISFPPIVRRTTVFKLSIDASDNQVMTRRFLVASLCIGVQILCQSSSDHTSRIVKKASHSKGIQVCMVSSIRSSVYTARGVLTEARSRSQSLPFPLRFRLTTRPIAFPSGAIPLKRTDRAMSLASASMPPRDSVINEPDCRGISWLRPSKGLFSYNFLLSCVEEGTHLSAVTWPVQGQMSSSGRWASMSQGCSAVSTFTH